MKKIGFYNVLAIGIVFLFLACTDRASSQSQITPSMVASESTTAPKKLGLQECVDIALQRNLRRPASKFAVEIAETRHRQALSAWCPQFIARSAITRMDQEPNFIFPEETSDYTISGIAPVPVVATVNVPEKEIKLMDRQSVVNSLGMTFPLYTGGIREAVAGQAKVGIDAALQEQRKTDLQIVFDVKRYYYALVLASKIRQITKDTLDQLEVTLQITERFFTSGSGKVKKTDFLRNKVIVEGVRSSLAEVEGNMSSARSALINSLGLDWNDAIEPADEDLPSVPIALDVGKCVAVSYEFNPDWAKLKAGLKAAEARIMEAKGGNLPKVALTGNLNFVDNSYEKGIATSRNKSNWSVGLGMEISLFDGNLTLNKIREARAALKKLEMEKNLLREGIALQIQVLVNKIVAAGKQVESLKSAVSTAQENSELNKKAYQVDLAETKDVIEAQLTESFTRGLKERALYEQITNLAELDLTIGREINSLLESPAASGK